MKITRVDATPLAIPLAQEFHWAGGAQVGANIVLFTVHTDDGVDGLRRVDLRGPARRRRARRADGTPVRRPFARRRRGDPAVGLDRGALEDVPAVHEARLRGLEVACWDALGRALGVPTRTFFGGAVHGRSSTTSASSRATSPERLAAHARELAAEGFGVIYLKVGRGARDDDACVAAVREAIGPEPLLRIDPNEAWDLATAVDRIRRLEQYDLDWVEQPTPAGDVNGLAHVRRSVDAKIAADQSVFTTSQLRHVLENEAADVIVQGSHDAGGLLRFRQQAFMCDAHGLKVNRHAFMESEISFFANAQVASTIPNLTTGNQIMHQLLAERLTRGEAPDITGGRYRLNDAPGHGFEIDEDAVARAHERWQRDGAYNTIESLGAER